MKTRCDIFEEIHLKKLPLWEDLPELDLYLDQVLYYVNKVSQTRVDRDVKGITSSMINNYVKNGHLEKPIRKKYQRHQIARLIAIAFLKNVFSLQEIGETLEVLRQNYSSEDLYNLFVICMNEEAEVPEIIAYSCLAVRSYYKARLLTIELGGKDNESNL